MFLVFCLKVIKYLYVVTQEKSRFLTLNICESNNKDEHNGRRSELLTAFCKGPHGFPEKGEDDAIHLILLPDFTANNDVLKF